MPLARLRSSLPVATVPRARLRPSLPFALAAALVAAISAPWLLPNYYLHTLTMAGIFIMLTSGLNLIHGYVGRLSLGHTAFYGLGAYSAALLSTLLGGGLLLTIPAAALIAALAGLVIGHITLRFRGAYFVLVTLAFAAILQLFANNLVDFTGGPMGLSGVASPLIHRALGRLPPVRVEGQLLLAGARLRRADRVHRLARRPLAARRCDGRDSRRREPRRVGRRQRVPLFDDRVRARRRPSPVSPVPSTRTTSVSSVPRSSRSTS